MIHKIANIKKILLKVISIEQSNRVLEFSIFHELIDDDISSTQFPLVRESAVLSPAPF